MDKARILRQLPLWAGLLLFFIGAVDPLEGSVFVTAGAVLVAFHKHRTRNALWKHYLAASLLVVVGVALMFVLSAAGGVNEGEWGWFVPLALYPAGWLYAVVLMVLELARQKSKP